MTLPHIALLGGDGALSGVPRYIDHLARALDPVARISIVSDIDRGGYAFAAARGVPHTQIEGLATSVRPLRILRAAARLRRFIAEQKPDIVWANARMTQPLARLVTPRDVTLVLTYHGVPCGPGHGALRSHISWMQEQVAQRLSRPQDLVFLTPRDSRAFGPVTARRHNVHVLPNCSDLGGFAPNDPPPDPQIVMLTRDARQKNLDAAAAIMAHLPDVRLELYGAGTDTQHLRDRFARALPPEALARIAFNGPVEDVRPALRAADLLLSTSRYEGLSISMLEAMEYGLPIATTPVGGTNMMGATHPMMRLIDTSEPDSAAQIITAMLGRFRADRTAQQTAIHAAWEAQFSPPVWQAGALDLFGQITRRAGF